MAVSSNASGNLNKDQNTSSIQDRRYGVLKQSEVLTLHYIPAFFVEIRVDIPKLYTPKTIYV